MEPMSSVSTGACHRSYFRTMTLSCNLFPLQLSQTSLMPFPRSWLLVFKVSNTDLIFAPNKKKTKTLQLSLVITKLKEHCLVGKSDWIYQEKIPFFCRTQGGAYVHSDRLTVTSPVLMWVKVWTNFIVSLLEVFVVYGSTSYSLPLK